MSKLQTILLFTFLIWYTPDIQSQQLTAVSDTLELDQIVITATKLPVTVRETITPAIVIYRNEIDRSSSRDLAQLLNQYSGIRLNNIQGTPSANQSLFMRGAGGEYTLILMDGLAIKDPSGVGGAVDLRSIPLQNIERIEILKGNQSTLYGSDALAGVINIITNNEANSNFDPSVNLSYGTYNSFNGSASINGAVSDQIGYALHYSKETSDGISAAKDPIGTGDYNADGFSHDTFNGRFYLNITEKLTISPSFRYSDYSGDYDQGAFQDGENRFDLKSLNPSIRATYKSDKVSIHSGYSYIRTERMFNDSYGLTEFDGRFHNLDTYSTIDLSSSLSLLTGINIQSSLLPENSSNSEQFSTNIISPYSTILFSPGSVFSSQIGIRYNKHSEFGSATNVTLNASYRLLDNLKVFSTFGTGFKAPTLNELFGPFGANQNLKPENSREFSAGFEIYTPDNRLNLALNYFNRSIEDRIIYVFDPGYLNRDRENSDGIEISGNWKFSINNLLTVYYNRITGETIQLNELGNRQDSAGLIRIPKHNFGLSASIQLSKSLNINPEAEWVSERTDLFFNPETFIAEEVTLESYLLIHLHAEYELSSLKSILFGSLRNLLNSDFTEVYGFRTMGTHGRVGIRFQF
ncbi:MAG: TonB-dependent receptor [Balneolaceae bacterium]